MSGWKEIQYDEDKGFKVHFSKRITNLTFVALLSDWTNQYFDDKQVFNWWPVIYLTESHLGNHRKAHMFAFCLI